MTEKTADPVWKGRGEFTMLPIRGIYELAIRVNDLSRSEQFYRDLLGLDVGARDERRNWLFLRVAGHAGMILLQEDKGHWPTQHFAFTVEEADIEAAAAALRECGVVATGPLFHEWMPAKSVYFCDPDGHELELCAPIEARQEPGRARGLGSVRVLGASAENASQYRVSVSGTIGARPAQVYAVIADYRQQHPQIVPPEYFRRLEVIQGGMGAGTRTRVTMRVLGRTRVFEQVVSEPEPGRVLMETNQDGSGVTTFAVDDDDGGESARVTIATDIEHRPGVSGFLERLFASLMLPRIYRKELARLAVYMAQQRPANEAGC